MRLYVLAVALVLVAAGAFGRSVYDQNTKSDHAARIQQYLLENVQAVKDGDDQSSAPASQEAPRRSLGEAASTAGSPGFTVDNSYDDWQWTYAQHHVEFRGTPSIQFSYIDRKGLENGTPKHGYNVYNPLSGGSWPRGAAIGCELQLGDDQGYNPNLDVNSKGRVVIGGHQTIWTSGPPLDNVTWWQPTTPFSCLFAMSVIDSSQYKTGMINYKKDSARLYNVLIEVQQWGSDTVTHLLAQQAAQGNSIPGKTNCTVVPLQYFRKTTFGASGSWLGPQTLDTCQRMAHLCASRVSPKVAVIYLQYTAAGIANNNFNDQAVYYRESDSIGTTWKAKVNITPYDRTAGPSYTPWVEARGLYDSNDKLHIIFNGSPVLQDPYNNPDQQWNLLTTGSSLLHWSNSTGNITRIHNAEWDFDTYTYGSLFCGFVGTNMLTTGAFGISECNGHLYVVWVMGNDLGAYPVIGNDCVTGGIRDARFKANGEIYMSVSSSLDGLLWDKYRNLTNSHTPKCDSAGYGGVCMSDVRPTMSRYGMDATAYGGALTWPDTGINPGAGPYTGNHWLHMFWVEDHWPDQKALSPATIANASIVGTNNPLKWARVACVTPVSAPLIAVGPKSIGYPSWTHHGKPDTTIITVTNDGNATLNVTQIGTHKVSPTGPNWLATTASSLTVNAGVGNTATFGLIVNAGGAIKTPGTGVVMTGDIFLKTNAAVPGDSISIKIENFLVADTLVDQKWDTVVTTCTRLIVSNNGDIGGGTGRSRVNMDYRAIGGECDTSGAADVYLYEGGPIVIRKTGVSSYAYSNQMHQVNFMSDEAFKPYMAVAPGPITGTGYDGYFTGTFVNKDTTIGVQRTYYAPNVSSDSCNFVIQKSVFFGLGGAKTNVTLGEDIDWDVPTMNNNSNNDGRILADKGAVYQQGLDTSSTRCTKHYRRFASTTFLGMYTPTEKTANPCANDVQFYGAYVMNNDTLFKYTNDTLTNSAKGTYFWNQMSALSGLSAAPVQGKDQHTVLTYKHNIPSLDTLTVYSAQVSVKNGDTTFLKASIDKAFQWYAKHLRPGCPSLAQPGSCCYAGSADGRTGNVDCDPGKGVDISDLSALIDNLFINFTPLCCQSAANIDGSPDGGIDISDLSALIDNLFINFTPTAMCL
ncbi:MAG: hypothetical protein HY851_11370 [candidate division Zixibacteria bacterium]|nr:hypothetical protein [candidate division Zixibacteria bacterium]